MSNTQDPILEEQCRPLLEESAGQDAVPEPRQVDQTEHTCALWGPRCIGGENK